MMLKKIKRDKFQLYLPDLSDLLGDIINWDGNNGLANTWGIYHKYPNNNFLLAIGMSDVQMCSPNLSNDGVEQSNSFGNQATLPNASNRSGIEDKHLVDNDAQDDTDDEKKPTAAMKNLIRIVKTKIIITNLPHLGYKIFAEV